TANYSDSSTLDVTSLVTWNNLVKGQTSVKGTYGDKEVTVNGLTIKASAAFTKATSSTTLKEGDEILLASNGNVTGEFVEASKSYFKFETNAEVNGMITPTSITSTFILGGSASNGWTLMHDGKYVKFTGTSNGNMILEETTTVSNDHKFTITLNDSSSSIVNKRYNGRALMFNANGNPNRFTNYASSPSGDIKGITIYYKAGSIEDTITGVTLDKTTKQTIAINNTLSLTATVEGGSEADKTVTWSSSNAGVVSLSSTTTNTIIVTGIGAGVTTLTATSNGDDNYKDSIDIEVIDPNTVTSVSISNGNDVDGIAHINNTKTLNVTVLPELATNKNVTWSSSNTSVATVSNTGVVTSVKPGITT
ncbi:MAG: Ig-like domain-containing protein, partial [Erysipelotrichaceae bacterium]|nr:Ig-like domain-containing protein [Erysipelotrichaceae bacterium]